MLSQYQQLLLKNDYSELIKVCNHQIDQAPQIATNYWYLSLALLLQGQATDAELARLKGLENSNTTQGGINIEGFYETFRQESMRQEEIREYNIALSIRQYLRHIMPDRFDNLVQIVYLSLHLKIFTNELLKELNFLEFVRLNPQKVDSNTALQLIQNILFSPLSVEQSLYFVASLLPYIPDRDQCIELLLYFGAQCELDVGVKLVDVCKKVSPNNMMIPAYWVTLYINNHQYLKAVEVARSILPNAKDLWEKVVVTHLLLGALMSTGGHWQEAEQVFEQHQSLLKLLVEQGSVEMPETYLAYICISCFYATYFKDTPCATHTLQQQVLELFQANLQNSNFSYTQQYQRNHLLRRNSPSKRKLRIGYLSTSLRQHSIGWLARSLFQYHDHDNFEIYGYFPGYEGGKDFLQEWYVQQVDKPFREGVDFWGNQFLIADQIHRDEVDILIDLESVTSSMCSYVIALKPAPVQVTWLGWDASNMPAIDYYIADRYVLPENAQEYYSERIWRLPHTYIATDGFESTLATLDRDDLDIPANAITYFSSQTSYKRHPDTVRAQIQIIKQVPNSYYLVKGLSDEGAIQAYFYEIAKSEGLDYDRLRFLPRTKSAQEHRANMAIADVVLDTYPYNGATTTMETLWMGIPMVTRVGEQFVARNSYTMMMNAGITEGIAWTNEEYIEWGIRFGTEPDLRKEVAWKLRQSRKTSPLWNGRQFAKEMEKAYTEMWDIYLQGTP